MRDDDLDLIARSRSLDEKHERLDEALERLLEGPPCRSSWPLH